MNSESVCGDVSAQLINLGVTVFFSCLIWLFYRKETVPATKEYATAFPRFWVGFIDSGVLWPVGFLGTITCLSDVSPFITAVVLLLQSLAWIFYTVFLHARYGQTIGKMVTKVRVVDYRTSEKLTFKQACLRESIPFALTLCLMSYQLFAVLAWGVKPDAVEQSDLVRNKWIFRLLSAASGVWFLVEVLTMLTNEKRRALHDFIAGTVVVRTNMHECSESGQMQEERA